MSLMYGLAIVCRRLSHPLREEYVAFACPPYVLLHWHSVFICVSCCLWKRPLHLNVTVPNVGLLIVHSWAPACDAEPRPTFAQMPRPRCWHSHHDVGALSAARLGVY